MKLVLPQYFIASFFKLDEKCVLEAFFRPRTELSLRDCYRIQMLFRSDCCGERLAMGEGALQVQQEKPAAKPKVSCVSKADALWFCYSPVYQMTEYYREGTFDNCHSKWTELFDCLSLKTKPADQIQAILEERERKKPHIWEFRTPEEASKHWKEEFGHLQD